jgi:hypothetical protein
MRSVTYLNKNTICQYTQLMMYSSESQNMNPHLSLSLSLDTSPLFQLNFLISTIFYNASGYTNLLFCHLSTIYPTPHFVQYQTVGGFARWGALSYWVTGPIRSFPQNLTTIAQHLYLQSKPWHLHFHWE